MVICLIGPSGSGKDTQAEFLAEKYNIPMFSTGELFRRGIERGEKLALKAAEYADRGEWIPDELIIEIAQNYINENCPNGFIVTGFPRMVAQLDLLRDSLKKNNQDYDLIIHFNLSDDISLIRMRAQAEQQIKLGKPRPDAKPEVMKKRLESYHKTIDPILKKAREWGILLEIDASGTVGEVKNLLFKEIEKKLPTKTLSD
jgi:adenylate kinase